MRTLTRLLFDQPHIIDDLARRERLIVWPFVGRANKPPVWVGEDQYRSLRAMCGPITVLAERRI